MQLKVKIALNFSELYGMLCVVSFGTI